MVVRLGKTESALARALQRDPSLLDRVERLMTIPAVGPITALTWAPEVGDVQRFSSIKKAISYCGLCGAEKSSVRPLGAETANGCLALDRAGTNAEAQTRAEGLKSFTHARSKARQESFCPLDTDLSRKSDYRKLRST